MYFGEISTNVSLLESRPKSQGDDQKLTLVFQMLERAYQKLQWVFFFFLESVQPDLFVSVQHEEYESDACYGDADVDATQ